MSKEKVEVYCELNSKTKDHPRQRELVFMYRGSSIHLRQCLVVWHDGSVGYLDEMGTTMDFDPEWADDLKILLDHVKWFADRSRPHWAKHTTDHKCSWERPDVSVDLHFYCSPKSFLEVESKKKELERAINEVLNRILKTPEEIEFNSLSTSQR